SAIGLGHTDFYYPFPDYKLPNVIISHRALAEPLFDPADLLASSHARDYTGSVYRHFDDALVFAQAVSNGLLADLSNSFLVAATGEAAARRQTEVELAAAYAVDRVPEFTTQTRFVRTSKGIQVIKEALQPHLPRRATFKNSFVLENLLGQSNYSRGRLLLWRVLRARAESGGNLQQFVGALKPWFEFILRYAVERSGASAERKTSRMNLADFVLPGSCLDLTPFNLVETGDALVPIDMEWKLDHVVPLGWITTRSISYCL